MGFGKFFRNDKGSISMFAGVLSVPILVGAGVAIDAMNLSNVQTKLQAAAEATALAMAAEGQTAVVNDANATALFNQNFHMSYATNAVVTADRMGINDTQIHIDVEIDVPTGMMKLIGIDTQKVRASARSAHDIRNVVSQTQFTIDGAEGWYDKEFYVFTKDADGNILTETKVLDYGNDRSHNNKTYDPPLANISNVFQLGTDYASWGIMMKVYPSDQGEREFNKKYVKVNANCRRSCAMHWVPDTSSPVTPVTYYSDVESLKAPSMFFPAKAMKKAGQIDNPPPPSPTLVNQWNTYIATPAGKATRFMSTGDCTTPEGESHQWEDGGNYEYNDFRFTLKCAETTVVTTAAGGGHARLVAAYTPSEPSNELEGGSNEAQ